MSIYGLIGLLVAFAAVAVSVVCLLVGHLISKRKASAAESLCWGGHIATILAMVVLTFCCGLLVFCFMTGDTSIEYVVQNQSHSSSGLAWLYKLAGLWSGRAGSLLLWAWLISVFNTVIAVRNMKKLEKIDNAALFVAELILGAFVGVLLFSESNMPFTAMAAENFNSAGQLTGAAAYWGMNVLLEHWAMAVHPPTLFIGYAGMTVPFAYAVAALITGDSSKAWVEKCTRITVFSWLLLGVGIGLGAFWAYVVLGWGGYWGWDPVENASFLPWLIGLALIHSFTVYRKRGALKRWSVMYACIAFAFVILGTFITRTGVVESVHAFEGDPVSFALFLTLIIVAALVGAVGLVIRWKHFSSDSAGGDDFESFASKEAAYFINNLIMLVAAIVLAYMTLAPAFPTFLPFGGQAIPTGKYDQIARILGIIYLFVLSVCPMLAWGKTEGKQFWKHARIPGIAAIVLFVVLMVYFFTTLLPGYNAIIAAGGTYASDLADEGPAWFYNGLAAIGLFVASLLFFNSLFMLARGIRRHAEGHDINVFKAAWWLVRNKAATYGGFISHLAMSIILVGLIGSSMYVTESSGYMGYDATTDKATSDFTVKDYTLKYKDNSVDPQPDGIDIIYTVRFDVYKNGNYLTTVAPSVQIVTTTQQQKLNAAVVSFPTEDLFVVYRGIDNTGAFALDVKVNPLIGFVWGGAVILLLGVAVSAFGRRKKTAKDGSPEDGGTKAQGAPTAKGGKGEKAESAPTAKGGTKAESAPTAKGGKGEKTAALETPSEERPKNP